MKINVNVMIIINIHLKIINLVQGKKTKKCKNYNKCKSTFSKFMSGYEKYYDPDGMGKIN